MRNIAPELRIGNIIQKDFELYVVDSRDIFLIDQYYLDKKESLLNFKSLPIEKTLLNKFGFKKTNIIHNDKSVSEDVFRLNNYAVKFDPVGAILIHTIYNSEWHYISTLKSIHNLQNIYFELENKELTFK